MTRALRALTCDRTVLVIAHRLTTAATADQVVFLEHGRVAEAGTHDALLASGGRYADQWRERERAGHWRLVASTGEEEPVAG